MNLIFILYELFVHIARGKMKSTKERALLTQGSGEYDYSFSMPEVLPLLPDIKIEAISNRT